VSASDLALLAGTPDSEFTGLRGRPTLTEQGTCEIALQTDTETGSVSVQVTFRGHGLSAELLDNDTRLRWLSDCLNKEFALDLAEMKRVLS